jgi:hypothetical protein
VGSQRDEIERRLTRLARERADLVAQREALFVGGPDTVDVEQRLTRLNRRIQEIAKEDKSAVEELSRLRGGDD